MQTNTCQKSDGTDLRKVTLTEALLEMKHAFEGASFHTLVWILISQPESGTTPGSNLKVTLPHLGEHAPYGEKQSQTCLSQRALKVLTDCVALNLPPC